MNKQIKPSTLCINCINLSTCTYCRSQSVPIIFCEEFTCDEPDSLQANAAQISSVEDYPEKDSQTGLCINCENNKTCALQKSGVNVIECQEYRYAPAADSAGFHHVKDARPISRVA